MQQIQFDESGTQLYSSSESTAIRKRAPTLARVTHRNVRCDPPLVDQCNIAGWSGEPRIDRKRADPRRAQPVAPILNDPPGSEPDLNERPQWRHLTLRGNLKQVLLSGVEAVQCA
jgi:hypothetical protein